MSAVKDITNQKFNRLTVLYRNGSSGGKAVWHCRCDCGNECDVAGQYLRNGHTVSCGCYQKEQTSIAARKNAIDLTQQRFGFLTAIEPTDKRSGSCVIWKCKCDCGNIAYVASNELKRQSTKSCGCMKTKLNVEAHKIPMIGKKFGKLLVIQENGQETDGSYNYLCQCDCGNTKTINGVSLRKGNTTSCGCINYSIGELNIKTILDNNNIKYISEYQVKELNNKRFDFAIVQNGQIIRIVEFDGRQHFEASNSIWEATCSFEERKRRDQEKNQWCKDNNIPLVRIPYWERDNITLDMILGDQYLI